MQYLDTLSHIIRKAGDAILNIYHNENFSQTVEWKSDDSPLTLADKAAHDMICKNLIINYPHIPILSEEGSTIPYSTRQDWDTFWLIDPLDGTKEFIKRNGEFTVNIALIQDGEPIVGAVFAPVKNWLFFAEKGNGAIKIDENGTIFPLKNCQESLENRPIHIIASRSHLSPETADFIAKYPEAETISMGSSLKFMLVAEGTADIYPRFAPTMEWDTAAAHIIVTESGADIFQYPSQEKMIYNKENLLNPHFLVLGKRAQNL